MGKVFELARSINKTGAFRVKRDAHTKQDIKDFVKAFGESENLYMSVFEFKETSKGVPLYESAIPDRIFCEIDGANHGLLNEDTWRDLQRLIDWCRSEEQSTGLNLKPQIWFSGSSGYHIIFTLPESMLEYKNDKVIKRINVRIKDLSGSKLLDMQANHGFSQLRRIPNTINHKSGYYCIPLTIEEAYQYPPDRVLDLAKKPRRIINTVGDSDYFVDIIKMLNDKLITEATEAIKAPKLSVDEHVREEYLKRIRPCIRRMMEKDNPNFKESTWVACEMFRCNYSIDKILEFFKLIRKERFNYKLTRYQLEMLQTKGIYAPSCATLKELGYCNDEIHPKKDQEERREFV